MRRRLRLWWRAAVAAAAILSPHAAAADQPVHDIQIAATQYAFEPATIQVTDPVIQWNRSLLAIVRTPGAQPATIHPTRSFAILG
jgi:hypothetical protein